MSKNKRTDYSKVKQKSDSSSVRFNLEHLSFIKKREPLLKSSQQVVDFLLEAYYKIYKVQPSNPFEVPFSSEVIDAAKDKIEISESGDEFHFVKPLTLNTPKVSQFDAYLQEISKTTWSGDLEILMAEAKKEKDILPQQQIKLQMFAMEHAKTFVN